MSIEKPKKTHDDMVAEWMRDPAFKVEYDALEEEYQLLREMLHARSRAGLTQEEVAKRMGTKAPYCTIRSDHYAQ